MTTPMENLDAIMPFSVHFEPNGTVGVKVINSPQAGNTYYAVPAGTYMVQMSYDGASAAKLAGRALGSTQWMTGLPSIPSAAVGTPRQSGMTQVNLPQGGRFHIEFPQTVAAGTYGTGAINFYPMPLATT